MEKYGIGLILVIQDSTHNQDEKIQSMMTYVKEFIEFATMYQDPKHSNTDYYDLFKSKKRHGDSSRRADRISLKTI